MTKRKAQLLPLLIGMLIVQADCQAISNGRPTTVSRQSTPAASLDGLASIAEEEVTSLAKAMPPERYGFAPSPSIFVPGRQTAFSGVRTFGQLVIHVAQTNYGLAARIGGPQPEIDPKSLSALTDKDQIVEALETSFAYVHKAIATITPENSSDVVPAPFSNPMTRATLAAFVAVHTTNECGQLVEYLRMNAIVPPTSQKK